MSVQKKKKTGKRRNFAGFLVILILVGVMTVQVIHAPAQPPQQHRLAQRGQLGGDIVLHPSQPNRRLSSDMRGAGASS